MTDNSSRMREQPAPPRMHIVDLNPLLADVTSLDHFLQRTTGVWTTIYDDMTDKETLWVFVANRCIDTKYWPAAMAVADHARSESDLVLKNMISRHTELADGGDMRNAYEEILLFVKDKPTYQFNKDSIRVAHVYKGNEWGGERDKGNSAYHDTEVRRYNPEGKDPGNVWLDERRDHTPDETIDETRPLTRGEAVKRCIRAGSIEGETVHLWGTDDSFADVVTAEHRDIELHSFNEVDA